VRPSGRLNHVGGARAGEEYSINVPVPQGSHEDTWFSPLEHSVIPAAEGFRPELVLVSAGHDAHGDDHQGGGERDASSFADAAT
jgi:acetoin utilization deacetylase AcuC-like enzyme